MGLRAGGLMVLAAVFAARALAAQGAPCCETKTVILRITNRILEANGVGFPVEIVVLNGYDGKASGRRLASGSFRVTFDAQFLADRKSEAEIAGICAHEIAHRLLGHKRLWDPGWERSADSAAFTLLVGAGYDPRDYATATIGVILADSAVYDRARMAARDQLSKPDTSVAGRQRRLNPESPVVLRLIWLEDKYLEVTKRLAGLRSFLQTINAPTTTEMK